MLPMLISLKITRNHSATFKDADAINGYIKTILKNHKPSGHHSSSEQWLQDIKTYFIESEGKNVDYTLCFLNARRQ
jgi:hypothetical protein